MAKIPVDLTGLMANPDISLSSSPFAPTKIIIKRASFRKGVTPAHLKAFAIAPGTCPKGTKGTVVYKGKLVPKCAAIVARKKKK